MPIDSKKRLGGTKAPYLVGTLTAFGLLVWGLCELRSTTSPEEPSSLNTVGETEGPPALVGDDQALADAPPDGPREEPGVGDGVPVAVSGASSKDLSSLKGQVAIRPGGKEALVKLFSEVRSSGSHGLKNVAGMWSDQEGSFLFSGLEPGRYVVTAFWHSSPAEYSLAREGVELEAGRETDIGVLDERPGTSHEVMIGFREESETDSKWMPLDELFSSEAPLDGLRHLLKVDCYRRNRSDFLGRFSILTEVPVGEPFYLRGLYPGSWSFLVPVGMGKLPQPVYPYSFVRDRLPVDVEVPHSGIIDLPIYVIKRFETEFRLDRASEYSSDAATLSRGYTLTIVSREHTGERKSLNLACAEDTCSIRTRLRPGNYVLLLVPEGHDPETGYYAMQEFAVDESRGPIVIDIDPAPGATLLGTGAVPGAAVHLNAEDLLGLDVPGISWQQADEKGGFVFKGLPPNTTYKIEGTEREARLGDPGTATEVSLR